jgi:hypothetical protein
MMEQQKRMQDAMRAGQEQARMGGLAKNAGGMGGPRGPGGPGGGGGGAGNVDLTPANYHTPTGAVKAFLSALQAKDLDRLSESTALRARLEASGKNQELFSKISDLTLSDSEVDKLASALEGFTVTGENPPRSTGRVDVVLQKSGKNNSYITRKITVRHEKKGWGVMDISGPAEFKTPGMVRPRGNTGGRSKY